MVSIVFNSTEAISILFFVGREHVISQGRKDEEDARKMDSANPTSKQKKGVFCYGGASY